MYRYVKFIKHKNLVELAKNEVPASCSPETRYGGSIFHRVEFYGCVKPSARKIFIFTRFSRISSFRDSKTIILSAVKGYSGSGFDFLEILKGRFPKVYNFFGNYIGTDTPHRF